MDTVDDWLDATTPSARGIAPIAPTSDRVGTKTPVTRQFDRMIETQRLPTLPEDHRHRTGPGSRLMLSDLRHEVKQTADCYRATVDRYRDLAEQAVRGSIINLNGATQLVGHSST